MGWKDILDFVADGKASFNPDHSGYGLEDLLLFSAFSSHNSFNPDHSGYGLEEDIKVLIAAQEKVSIPIILDMGWKHSLGRVELGPRSFNPDHSGYGLEAVVEHKNMLLILVSIPIILDMGWKLCRPQVLGTSGKEFQSRSFWIWAGSCKAGLFGTGPDEFQSRSFWIWAGSFYWATRGGYWAGFNPDHSGYGLEDSNG